MIHYISPPWVDTGMLLLEFDKDGVKMSHMTLMLKSDSGIM